MSQHPVSPYQILFVEVMSQLEVKNSRKQVEFRSDVYKCFEIFSKFSYYLFLTPLKTEVSCSGRVSVGATLFRKILCGVLCITFCIYRFTTLGIRFVSLKRSLQDDPSQLYGLADYLLYTSGSLCFLYLNMFKRDMFQQLYETCYQLLDNKTILRGCTGMRRGRLLALIVCLVPIPKLLWMLSDALAPHFKGWTTNVKPTSMNGPFFDNFPACFMVPFRFIYFLVIIYCNIVAQYFLVQPRLCCIVVHKISKEFQAFLMEHPKASFDQIMEGYQKVRSLLAVINESTSTLTLFFVIEGMISLSGYFTVLLETKSWLVKVIILYHFLVFIYTTGSAAKAHVKFQKFRDFISENRERLGFRNDPNVNFLVNELHHNPLGLQAHTFIVTYSLLASVVGAVLTYLFIFLQIKPSP